jgi:hypothetical protein
MWGHVGSATDKKLVVRAERETVVVIRLSMMPADFQAFQDVYDSSSLQANLNASGNLESDRVFRLPSMWFPRGDHMASCTFHASSVHLSVATPSRG